MMKDNSINKINKTIFITAIIVLIIHSSYFFDWIVDDAGISFGYAKNLANGYGLVLNPSSSPVEAYSNPLWVLVIAVLIQLKIFDPYITVAIFGLLLYIGSFVIIYRISKLITPVDTISIHSFVPLILAFSTPFIAWGMSGLETPLFVFLLLFSTLLYIREINGLSAYPLSAIAFFLVAITRPEGFGYFGLAVLHRGVVLYRERTLKRDIGWLIAFVLPFIGFIAWRYSYFGYPLSNTFYYKVDSSTKVSLGTGLQYIINYIFKYNMWVLTVAALPIIDSLLDVGKNSSDRNMADRIFLGLMLIGTLVYTVYTGGDWMMEFRFLVPALPFALLILQVGIESLIQKVEDKFKISTYSVAITVFFLLSLVLIQPSLVATPQASSTPTLPMDRVHENEEFAVTQAERAGVADNASLLTPDLGAHAYYSNLRYVDLAGLADITIGHHQYSPPIFSTYIFEETKPTFIYTHQLWTYRSKIKSYPQFKRDYIPMRDRSIDEAEWFVRKDVFITSNPNPDSDTDLVVNDSVELIGFTNHNNVSHPGGEIQYTLYWRLINSTEKSYEVSIQFSRNGEPAHTQTRDIIYGWHPVRNWKDDRSYLEQYKLDIPTALSEGEYNVSINVSNGEVEETTDLGKVVVDNATAIQTANNYHQEAISTDDSRKSLNLIKDAQRIRPNNETYQEKHGEYQEEVNYEYMKKAEDEYQNGNPDKALNFIKKTQDRWLHNQSARKIRTRVSNHFVSQAIEARKSGNTRRAFVLYDKALEANAKNTEALYWKTELNAHPSVKNFVNTVPPDATTVNVSFNEKIDLVGYEVANDPVTIGDKFAVIYYFECRQAIDRDYHLHSYYAYEGDGRGFQVDHEIPSITQCSPGDIIKDVTFVDVSNVSSDTSFTQQIVIKHPESGERLSPQTNELEINDSDRVVLTELNLTQDS